MTVFTKHKVGAAPSADANRSRFGGSHSTTITSQEQFEDSSAIGATAPSDSSKIQPGSAPHFGILTDGARAKLIGSFEGQFGHTGHPKFVELTVDEAILHAAKNSDYAAGGDPLGNFSRVAAILALYPGLDLSDRRVVALVYALKQLDAVLWGLAKRIQHKVEGLNARLQDISVYTKLVMCMNTENLDARK